MKSPRPDPPSAGSAEHLEAGELARLSSSTAEHIQRFAQLGLLRASPGGTYTRGDVTRVRLLVALERSGIALDDLASVAPEKRLSLDFAAQLVPDAVGLTDQTHAEALAGLELDAELAQRLQLALGIPTRSAGDPIREDDLELFTLIARAREYGVAEESLLRLMRAFGMSMRHIVEVQRELFRENIEDRLLASGVSYQDMMDSAAETRLRLQRLGFRAVYLLHRRFLEEAVYENIVSRLEEMLEEHGIRRPGAGASRTIAFIDLSGYSRMTDEAGDERAASYATRLVEIALDRCSGAGCRLVKTLGDGVMLRFTSAEEAVVSALEIVELADRSGLPPARAGLAAGPAIQRDGDFFGRVVNLAARLVDMAGPGRVLVSETVVEAVGDDRLAFHPLGSVAIEGFKSPARVYAASRFPEAR